MKAYDYSGRKRVILLEGDRVQGEFVISITKRHTWVEPFYVKIWDKGHEWASVVHSDAFTAKVEDGGCDLSHASIRGASMDAILEVLDEMTAACIAAAKCARRSMRTEGGES